MAQDSMTLWNQVCATDPAHTKKFTKGGGFSGTAIKPFWLIKRATETFGPVGIGWGWEEIENRTVAGVWCSKVRLWYVAPCGGHAGTTGRIEQWGQTVMEGQNKNGPFVDEEAPKKAVTDAVTKCLSYLGFAGDVHLGLFDDSKYVTEVNAEFRKAEQEGSKLWKSAAERKRFVEGLVAAFRASLTAEELVGHAGDNLETMKAMKAGSETDRLSHAELQKVYAQELARLRQAETDRAAYGPGFADTPARDGAAA